VSKGSGGLNSQGSVSKENYGGSMQLRFIPGSKPNGNNRISQKVVGGSESEKNILPEGNCIVVKSDYDVAYLAYSKLMIILSNVDYCNTHDPIIRTLLS